MLRRYKEEYFNYLDPRRAALNARGCCWRDYLRIEQPLARPHPGAPGLSQSDVDQLPANLTNPMGHGKEADRRMCPMHGLDVEVMAMPMCVDVTRHAAIAAHRAADAYVALDKSIELLTRAFQQAMAVFFVSFASPKSPRAHSAQRCHN